MKNIYYDSKLINYIEENIMMENIHQFIYGVDCDERTEFLKSLEYSYPLIYNTYSPMAIYMIDYFLPKIVEKSFNIDKRKLISREFFNLSIAYNITKRICMNEGINNNDNFQRFFDNNQSLINIPENVEINNFDELCLSIKKSMDMYIKLYNDSIYNNINIKEAFSKLISIDGVEYAKDIKNMLNNKAYFALIIENNDDIADLCIKTINSFVGSRINRDISMKVATDIEKWPVLYNLSGIHIENIHDFDIVILDEKEKRYIKKHNWR